MDLPSRYADHLATLDERRFGDLGQSVADDVVHNDRSLGLDGYRAMLEDDVATFPDLFFDLVHLAVDAALRLQLPRDGS